MKEKKFKDYLQLAQDATAPVDMDEIIASPPSAPAAASSITDQDEVIRLRNAMADLRAKNMMAKQGLESYAKQIPEGIKQAKELAQKLASKTSKIATEAAPVVEKKLASLAGKKALLGVLSMGLGATTDLLASDDVNPAEDTQVMDKRSQQFADQAIKDTIGQEKFEELKEGSEELSKSSLTEDLEKLLPNKKKSDESRSYSDYIKDRKKLMGYE